MMKKKKKKKKKKEKKRRRRKQKKKTCRQLKAILHEALNYHMPMTFATH